eukprot:9374335-Alexandrium_andersonii.AAC.1
MLAIDHPPRAPGHLTPVASEDESAAVNDTVLLRRLGFPRRHLLLPPRLSRIHLPKRMDAGVRPDWVRPRLEP